MELVNNNNRFFFHLSPTSSHLHSLQVENCDSNSRLVAYGDYNGKFGLEKVYTINSAAGEICLKLFGGI